MIENIRTPYYLVDEALMMKNLKCLKSVSDATDCKILLAQKAFSMYSMYPMIMNYLDGTTASSLYEAKLGHEEFGKETHIFAPAYCPDEIEEIASICDHMIFNSLEQWRRYKNIVKSVNPKIQCGLRINPEYSEVETEIYNPCSEKSRLGVTLTEIGDYDLTEFDGLHFHTMCEQNSDVLSRTLQVVEEKFGHVLPYMKWINFGGGHHITRDDYDLETLITCICHMKETYHVQVYLEPGEAVALNAGYLVTSVLELMHKDMDIAILDTSAACHMPDVLEMPYRPNVVGAKRPGEAKYSYRFGGPTCLAGDIIGEYAFDSPLQVGDQITFCDMAIYTMVKNNTFNGIALPSIYKKTISGDIQIVKNFAYSDFKSRLS